MFISTKGSNFHPGLNPRAMLGRTVHQKINDLTRRAFTEKLTKRLFKPLDAPSVYQA